MVKVASSIIVNVPANRAFEVITAFERYPKFLSEITSAKILKGTAKKAEVAFQMDMVQKVNYTLSFTMASNELVKWVFVKGDSILKDNSGSWRIEAQTPKKTKVSYEANVELSMWLPTSILKSMLEDNLPRMLEKFKKEMEKGA